MFVFDRDLFAAAKYTDTERAIFQKYARTIVLAPAKQPIRGYALDIVRLIRNRRRRAFC